MRRARSVTTLIAAAVLVLTVALALLAAGCSGSAGQEAVPADDRAEATDFSVEALDGSGELSLADYAGTPVVLNFWASWCPPCREEMPALAKFAAENPGVAVVGLAVDDAPADSRRFAEGLGIDFPLGIDSDGSVAADYGATGLPVTVVIDAEGRIASTLFGTVTEAELEKLTKQAT